MIEPADETALSEALAGAGGPLEIRGGGTRPVGRGEGEVLSTRALSGVKLYEPEALTLVVGAGTALAEVEALLSAEGQRLAFEPMDHRALMGIVGEPTIGGMVAANISGPRRVQSGACRDHLLGVRFVDGAGRVLSNGGRVMKNVTGYDLVKLLAGSWGTLGVLSEVSLKVLPVPETFGTLRLPELDVSEGVQAMSAALGSPFEVTGAAWGPEGVSLRVEGFADQVAYRLGRLRDMLGGEVIDEDPWPAIRDVTDFAGQEGDVWRIHARPSAAPELAERIRGTELRMDWGGGLIWALCAPGHDLRADLGAFDGHARRERGLGPAFGARPSGVGALEQGIRQRFDPRGILNPGRMS
ncbi:MAG: 2-hydroxy-acid oxidase [Rhodobacterales bacterium]|nr:MAG: 2-hydroxy-acid oxidase [Rhodobacterales bacterium]